MPYRVEPVDFRCLSCNAEWRRMNPVGKVPVMSQSAFKMFESGAMIQHLLEVYDEDHKLQPRPGLRSTATFCSGAGLRRRPSVAPQASWPTTGVSLPRVASPSPSWKRCENERVHACWPSMMPSPTVDLT